MTGFCYLPADVFRYRESGRMLARSENLTGEKDYFTLAAGMKIECFVLRRGCTQDVICRDRNRKKRLSSATKDDTNCRCEKCGQTFVDEDELVVMRDLHGGRLLLRCPDKEDCTYHEVETRDGWPDFPGAATCCYVSSSSDESAVVHGQLRRCFEALGPDFSLSVLRPRRRRAVLAQSKLPAAPRDNKGEDSDDDYHEHQIHGKNGWSRIFFLRYGEKYIQTLQNEMQKCKQYHTARALLFYDITFGRSTGCVVIPNDIVEYIRYFVAALFL